MNLYCPKCQNYLGLTRNACGSCGWLRPPQDQHTTCGQALWSQPVGGAVHGPPVLVGGLAVFAWGERRSGGGVTALDCASGEEKWRFETPFSVEGGITAAGELLLFATLELVGGAQIFAVETASGKLAWQQPLSGGAWSPPVVEENRVYIASGAGLLHCFDLRGGEEVHSSVFPARLFTLDRPTKTWLQGSDQPGFLVASCQEGLVQMINVLTGKPVWAQALKLPCRISSPALRLGAQLYLGCETGHIYTLNLRSQKLGCLGGGFGKPIVAAPAHAAGTLFVGAHDKALHAIDIQSGLEDRTWHYEHSISTTPLAAEGWVFFGANDGFIHAIDPGTEGEVWSYPVADRKPVCGSPAMADGVIYIGAGDGYAYALPWHLGCYERAAESRLAHAEFVQAGELFILAAHTSKQAKERQAFYEQAEKSFDCGGQPELAARLWEELRKEEKAACAWEHAAELQCGVDNNRAAEDYYRASRLFWRVGCEDEAARCAREAAKIGNWPLLRLKSWTNPRQVQGQPGSLTVRAENTGYSEASNILFRVGGSLLKPLCLQVVDSLACDAYFDLTFEITPTRLEDTLIVQTDYCGGEKRKIPFDASLKLKIDAVMGPHEINLGDMVWGDVTITSQDGRPVKVKTGDMVGTHIKIAMGA